MEEDLQQTIAGGRLRWYRTWIENGREVATEDGVELPPPELRRRLLDRDGTWELFVPGAKPAVVAHILAPLLELDRRAIVTLLRQRPGVAYVGTNHEVEWLHRALTVAGIASEKRRAENTVTGQP